MTFRHKTPRVKDRAYLDWIKQLPCIACAVEGRETYGVDPAHIRHAFPGWTPVGGGEKPDDWRSVPLCRMHHDEQHDNPPEPTWWARLGVYPPTVCAALREAYPSVVAGAAAIAFRAGISKVQRVPARIGGLAAPIVATPKPVMVRAHLTERRDENGNLEIILTSAGGGRDLIATRALVTPDSIERKA